MAVSQRWIGRRGSGGATSADNTIGIMISGVFDLDTSWCLVFEIAGGLLGGDNTCDGSRKDSVVTEQFLSNFG